MRTVLSMAILSVMLLTLPSAPAVAAQEGASPDAGQPFADVPRDHWAYEAVEELRRLGILRGYPPEKARPAAEGRTWTRPAGGGSGKQKAGRRGRPAPKQVTPIGAR